MDVDNAPRPLFQVTTPAHMIELFTPKLNFWGHCRQKLWRFEVPDFIDSVMRKVMRRDFLHKRSGSTPNSGNSHSGHHCPTSLLCGDLKPLQGREQSISEAYNDFTRPITDFTQDFILRHTFDMPINAFNCRVGSCENNRGSTLSRASRISNFFQHALLVEAGKLS